MSEALSPPVLLVLFVAVTLLVNLVGWFRDRRRLEALAEETERLRQAADQAMDGILSDVTGRREAERARQDSERMLASLVRNLPGVAFRSLIDEDWTMLFISDAVADLTGYPPSDFTERRVSLGSRIHPDDVARLAGTVERARAEQRTYSVEYRLRRADGRELWIWETGGVVTLEDGTECIDGVLLDVTETKLRHAEYESKLNAISRVLSVIEFDLNGCIVSANENAQRMMGYTEDEMRGQSHKVFCHPAYADSDAYRDFWRRLGRGEFDKGEYQRFGKHGRAVWIQASYNPILDAEGRPSKILKLATDVSARMEMEAALRDAKERAERAAASKSTFLANMSHEIRTPMNAVIGFTELLLETELDDRQRAHLNTVRQSARSLLGLLNDILDTAKLEKGVVEIEDVDFSLFSLCSEVVSSLRLSAQSKGLALDLDYDPVLGEFFKGDPLRIRQVLVNLIGNAIKFTEQGTVRLAVRRQGAHVHLAVHDTGIGIPADRIEKIFDRFAQADASMTRRFGGTGLGTSIARQLVELMHGRIEVESVVGEGSVFHVHLPLRAGAYVTPLPTAPDAALPPMRILVADDLAQNAELLSIGLGRLGHHVVSVYDGAQAVAAVRAEPFDVVLMDVQMPVLDGLEATRQIRAHETASGLRPVPIIALTASVQVEDQHATRSAGMQGFASKPVEMPQLLQEIARVTGLSADEGTAAPDADASSPAPSPAAEPAIQPAAAIAPEAALADAPATAPAPGPATDDRTAVDTIQGGFAWGSADALNLAIRRFLDAHADAGAQLAAHWQAGDLPAMAVLAHRLSGAAGNLALPALHSLSRRLEQLIKRDKRDDIPSVLSAIDDAFEAIRQTLDPMAGQPAAAPIGAEPANAVSAIQICARRVLDALHRGALDDAALEDLARHLRAGGQASRAQALEAAIGDFDFDRAEQLLQPLLRDASTAA